MTDEEMAEEWIDNNFCCNFIDECKSGERVRCSAYEERRDLLVNALAETTKELKAENKKLNEANNVLYESVVKVGKRNNALVAENKTAKKIIQEYVNWDYGDHTNCLPDITKKAEAFLNRK